MAELPKEELFTGKGKSMSDVYCYVMKGSTLLLADERNKKHLLDLLLCAHRACSCPVYAFCVTDDAAYFITEAEARKAEKQLFKEKGKLDNQKEVEKL